MAPATIAISDAARPGDEIVVGATGHTGVIDGLLGSVAMSVVHRSHVPVIIVPAKPVAVIGSTMKKIVVGVDGSPGSLQALEWAYNEALVSGAELTAVHGWIYPYSGAHTSVSEPRTQMQLDAMEELKASLESLGPRLNGGSLHVHARLVEQSPAEALLAESKDADLVVVGSRGRARDAAGVGEPHGGTARDMPGCRHPPQRILTKAKPAPSVSPEHETDGADGTSSPLQRCWEYLGTSAPEARRTV